jgi:DNA-binding transcriptional MerR regulator
MPELRAIADQLSALSSAGQGERDGDSASGSSVADSGQYEGTWPHALSHEPMLRVSDVLALVQSEFPALSTSKLRFLDNNGLVTPFRTPSGYRQYSPADVERLRFVLRCQRDQYQPLTVIAEHLAALDSGRMKLAVAPRPVEGEADKYLSDVDFAAAASIPVELLGQLDTEGLITQDAPGRYDREWLPLATAAHAYLSSGGDLRTLKSLIIVSRREADRAHAVARPDKMRGRAGEAEHTAQEFAEAAIAVFSTCVRADVSR